MTEERIVILVCDDNEAGRYTKVRPLRHAGFEVIEAATGTEALQRMAEHRPPLAVMDVKLPDISGLEVTATIKRDYPGTFVLQTSASFVGVEDRIRGLEEGADSYLIQPMEPRELVAGVRALLRIREVERELKTSRAAQRESENRYRQILASATDFAIMATDLDGLVTTWNTGARNILGWEALAMLGQDLRRIWTPEDRAVGADEAEIETARREGRAENQRWHLREDGSRFWANGLLMTLNDEAGELVGFLKILRDQTAQRNSDEALRDLNATLEQRVEDRTAELLAANDRLRQEMISREQVEETLRQSQKMEAVGQLTGGIAHDFNNLLTGITGNLELLKRRTAAGRTDVERYADAAMTAATRAAALTQRLLAFARRQALDPKPVETNKLVASMEDLLRRTVGESVAVEVVLAGGLWAAHCDAHQLENALLNLVINARDAMPEGGRVTIETANAYLDDAYAATQDDLEPGQYVALCVTDTGSGMPPEVVARAFDPFFTTKPIGQGTGLGLSMLYGFVKQSGGHVRIYSELGRGTTVKLYLPRHSGPRAEPDDPLATPETPPAEAGQTVLVVEDELMVRLLVLDVLEELNYAALEAEDGPSALRILESSARIDLLVTDVGLPGMNGRQLADRARELRPGLRVLFVTGYAHNAAIGNGLLEPGMEVISKPFALEALGRKVGAMIKLAAPT